ncbi:hypothetical protein ACFOEK_12090 [Litoribrevibacter euphylliae]|uniref:DUF2946 domain-containing protein n=1 Tax=Litoribrevibacter euphylliae TaxID=1834034 RepID=A0ABV7HD04_9GAMM
MARSWLTCLLALLVAMQSVIAMAADHQVHVTESQHIVFTYIDEQALSHESSHCENQGFQTETDKKPDSLLSTFECPHCCHTHTYLSDYFAPTVVDFLDNGNSNYAFTDLSFLISPDHRPPRS